MEDLEELKKLIEDGWREMRQVNRQMSATEIAMLREVMDDPRAIISALGEKNTAWPEVIRKLAVLAWDQVTLDSM